MRERRLGEIMVKLKLFTRFDVVSFIAFCAHILAKRVTLVLDSMQPNAEWRRGQQSRSNYIVSHLR